MKQNRLQQQWPNVVRKLQTCYVRVPEELWDKTEGKHDLIVDLIARTYAPGRSSIVIEAEVRDRLNEWISELEAQ